MSAPEYALEERMLAESDMYSLGCLIYSVHSKGQPPYKNHNNPATLRENVGKPISGTEQMEPDLRGLDDHCLQYGRDIDMDANSAVDLNDHSKSTESSFTNSSADVSILFFSVDFDTEFSRSIKFCIEIARREGVLYEGLDECIG